jgi:protein SCO1
MASNDRMTAGWSAAPFARPLWALIALAGLAGLSGCDKAPAPGTGSVTTPAGTAAAPAPADRSFTGIDITGAAYARNFVLTDPDGKTRTLDDFKGRVVVVFFGFTQCPDVCPTTLAELAQIKQSLGADGERLQAIFVTVDPERDTPELLKAYIGNFDPSFVALRGDLEQTKAVAREFKVYFAKVPGRVEGQYTIDHTAGSYVFDAQGRIRLFIRHGTPAAATAADLKRILAGA